VDVDSLQRELAPLVQAIREEQFGLARQLAAIIAQRLPDSPLRCTLELVGSGRLGEANDVFLTTVMNHLARMKPLSVHAGIYIDPDRFHRTMASIVATEYSREVDALFADLHETLPCAQALVPFRTSCDNVQPRGSHGLDLLGGVR
jgi:hypothetical protein